MPRSGGFTLIEMLVVVALLSGTALMAFSLTGERDEHAREEDSHARLAAIVSAVRGYPAPVWHGEMRLSGFVADNGRLPASLRELSARDELVDAGELAGAESLATAPGTLHAYRLRSPRFAPRTDADGWAESTPAPEVLDGTHEKLWKGLRRYLESRLGSPVFRDGWGNVAANAAADALNYGWLLQLPATAEAPWQVASGGRANATSPPSDAPRRSVAADDWSVDIAGWSITVRNLLGDDLATTLAGGYLHAALLVYENGVGGARWRRLSSNGISALADGGAATLTFAATPSTTRVPQGEHLLLLVRDSNGTPHDAASTGDEAPYTIGGVRQTRKIALFTGTTPPVVEMVLR